MINKGTIIKDGEIDLVELIRILILKKRVFYLSIASFLLLGIIYIIISPKKYECSATMLPITNNAGNDLGGIASLAGLAGINLGSMLESSLLDPQLYPQIVESYPFRKELINKKFKFKEYPRPLTIYEYANQDSVLGFFDVFLKYTVMLPLTLVEQFKASSLRNGSADSDSSLLYIDDMQNKAFAIIDGAIDVSSDQRSGVVYLYVRMEEPELAAQVSSEVLYLLQKHIINFKTQQLKQKLDFIQANYLEKRSEFESSLIKLYNFRDKNRNIISERIDPDYQRLMDDYELSSMLYKGIAQQYEQAKLQIKEETPAFQIIEPVIVPDDSSTPKIGIILALCVFLGFFAGLVLILGSQLFANTKISNIIERI